MIVDSYLIIIIVNNWNYFDLIEHFDDSIISVISSCKNDILTLMIVN